MVERSSNDYCSAKGGDQKNDYWSVKVAFRIMITDQQGWGPEEWFLISKGWWNNAEKNDYWSARVHTRIICAGQRVWGWE